METKINSPKEDLHAIREIMERSSKFLSLSGISGIFAGVVALIGATAAYFILLNTQDGLQDGSMTGFTANNTVLYLGIVGLLVLIIAPVGAFYFSFRKAKKANQHFWTNSSKQMIYHLMIPFVTGGIVAIIMILKNHTDLVASVLLIFYGLSLVNAGKFTVSEIHYLGLTEVILGIAALIFVSHGLLLWAVGFGIMHIVYGIMMYYKYER